MMRLTRDQRGFVLSGIALLLVLPAMLLAVSLLTIVEAGGEATSLQSLSDKVVYTGYDIERMIGYMSSNGLPINDNTLRELAENYQAATGLLVEFTPEGIYPLWIHVRIPTGAKHYAGTKYCKIEEIAIGKWRYNFEDKDEELDPPVDWDNNEPILLVERLDGRLRITVEMHEGGYIVDLYYSTENIWMNVGAHVGESVEVDELFLQINNVIVDVKDPRGVAHYTENISLT